MPRVPYTKLTTAQFATLSGQTVGSLKPYQIRQIWETLEKMSWKPRGSDSDVSGQPTLTQIQASLNTNQP
jgi:hypothetical protein